MPSAEPPRSEGRARASIAWIAFCFALYTGWTLALMRSVPATHDEFTYLRAARVMEREGWGGEQSFFHGPLPLLLTRIVPTPAHDEEPFAETLFRGRCGTLLFGWLALACTYALAARLGGSRSAALALLLAALHPLLIGYGALATVDLGQAAAIALVLLLAVRYSESRTDARALAVGLSLGVAFSIKYLALLYGPGTAIAVMALRWRGGRASGESLTRATARALLAGAVVTIAALFALHAACGFATGSAVPDPTLYRSESIRAFVAREPLGELVRLLPQGVLGGLDAYAWTWREPPQLYLRGRLAEVHPDYVFWSFALKTPELLLLLALLGGAALASRRTSLRASAARSALPGIAIAIVLPPLLYLSFAQGAPLGIRYALAALPPLLALAGCAALWVERTGTKAFAALLLCAGAWSALDIGTQSPHLLGYFSRSAGGPGAGYRSFAGSNCDWGQLARAGLDELRSRASAPFVALRRGDGPRFGRVALYVDDRPTPHPLDPARSRHWLDAFEPVDHAGAAWVLYELEREDFARARSGDDALLVEELAIAELGAGEEERTRALLPRLRPERRATLERVLALRASFANGLFAPSAAWELHQLWSALGRFDLARELVADPRFDAHPLAHLQRAQQLQAAGQSDAARVLLEALYEQRPERFSDPTLLLALVELNAQETYYARALRYLEPRISVFPAELRPRIEQRVTELRALAAELQRALAPR
ncbi:MAG: glycosyltransferase family 39 protein [Planctomycetes bacterium]|nr:glycosyltransferase family 39 protein [Planctomycetota bacterium]